MEWMDNRREAEGMKGGRDVRKERKGGETESKILGGIVGGKEGRKDEETEETCNYVTTQIKNKCKVVREEGEGRSGKEEIKRVEEPRA